MKSKNKTIRNVVGIVIILLLALAIWKWQWISDFIRGRGYQPSVQMGRIMQSLELTGEGEFLFRASRPTLNSRDEFNENCQTARDEEVAVVGCYANGDMYIYNVESAELDGIKELTTAHELLHAMWARMSGGEKQGLEDTLLESYREYKDILGEELSTYDSSQQQEEIFVRLGTEVANLPMELEKVYGRVFADQDKVAGFYDKYIRVFRAMETEMENLMAQMKVVQAEIDKMSSEYKRRVKQLNADIKSFNNCAARPGCFGTEAAFSSRRAVLVREKEALETMYGQVDNLVNQYNVLVEKYNVNVTHTEKLNQAMNSNSKPEGL